MAGDTPASRPPTHAGPTRLRSQGRRRYVDDMVGDATVECSGREFTPRRSGRRGQGRRVRRRRGQRRDAVMTVLVCIGPLETPGRGSRRTPSGSRPGRRGRRWRSPPSQKSWKPRTRSVARAVSPLLVRCLRMQMERAGTGGVRVSCALPPTLQPPRAHRWSTYRHAFVVSLAPTARRLVKSVDSGMLAFIVTADLDDTEHRYRPSAPGAVRYPKGLRPLIPGGLCRLCSLSQAVASHRLPTGRGV